MKNSNKLKENIMDEKEYKDIRNKILKGFKKAIKKMISEKALKNEKVIISRNGKIEELSAKEI
ncbi:MAG: hypothetical protein V1779_11265 [bacterium]